MGLAVNAGLSISNEERQNTGANSGIDLHLVQSLWLSFLTQGFKITKNLKLIFEKNA